jgi:hypothetical protein
MVEGSAFSVTSEERSRPMAGTGSGEVVVQMPGSAVMIMYASQCERDRSLRLARARQELAERGAGLPGWAALRDAERESAALEARNWLRAGEAAGLIAPCPVHASGTGQ